MKDRELDALMAEKAMGWKANKYADGSIRLWHYGDGTGQAATGNWSPSTHIAAAWEVAEKLGLLKNCYHLHQEGVGVTRGGTWTRTGWCWVVEQVLQPIGNNEVIARADTAPRALCLAAVKVIDAEVSV